MVEIYKNIDTTKMKEGLYELMEHRVNQVLNFAGPETLAMAGENYFRALEVVETIGIDCSEFKDKIKEFENEMSGGLEQKSN